MQQKTKFEENINLIRKLVWSFHNTTGIEFDELFAEASLAYCETLKSYDPERGKITTYIWLRISDRLKNYIKLHNEYYYPILYFEDIKIDKPISTNFLFESLSKEASEIAELILNYPYNFITLPKKEAKEKIWKIMRNKGWSWDKIICGFNDLKLAFQYSQIKNKNYVHTI